MNKRKISRIEKRMLAFILTLILCLQFGVVIGQDMTEVKAEKFVSADGDWEYTIVDGNVTITGYLGENREVEIPNKIEGYTVTGIGDSAFAQCYIEDIIIPSSVKSIGRYAFSFCINLTSIIIPDGITNIDSGVFYECTELKSITFPSSLNSIGDSAFFRCSALEDINLPSGLMSIGEYAFFRCSALEDINLPSGLMSIGECAFGCTGLKSVTLPDGIERIEQSTFGSCDRLTSVIFPASLRNIGEFAFSGCDGLTSIDIPLSVTDIEQWAFGNCNGLTNIIIPQNIINLDPMTFRCCDNLVSIAVSENNLKYDSRENCNAVIESKTNKLILGCNTTTIPLSVKTIGELAFDNCNKLNEISIPEGVTEIGYSSFSSCSELTSVKIPSSVTSIGSGAFENCIKLTSVEIPPSVVNMGHDIFKWSSNVVIYGYSNSYAEQYAGENDIPFIALDKDPTPAPPEDIEKPSDIPSYDKDIVNKLDVSEYIKGINLGSDTIHGPKLSIMGKELELFSLDANIKLEVGDKITYKRDEKNKTIQVLVGVESRDGKVDFSDDANDSKYWKDTYGEVKSLYTGLHRGKGTKKLYNQFRSLRKKLHAKNSTFLIKGEVKSVLFLEFSYATGEMELTEGGGIVSTELGAEWERRITSFPVAYVTIGAKASGELVFKVEPAWTGELGLDIGLNGGVGIGEKKHIKTYIEGGTKVTLKNKIKIPASSLKDGLTVKINGKGYLKAKVFGFAAGEVSKNFIDFDIYPKSSPEKKVRLLTEDNLKQKLEPMNMNNVPSLMALASTRSVEFEKQNLYPYCSTVMADLGDGKKLLIWVDDLGDKDEYNRTTLVYSYYDGTAWSAPAVAAESEYLNDYPVIYAKDGVAYVLWQQATMKCDVNTTYEELLSNTDLCCMKFENGVFDAPFTVTEQNDKYEMLQQIYVAEDGVYAVWVENSNNDPFMGEGETNTIYRKKLDGTSEKELVAENLSFVSNLLLGELDRKMVVLYQDDTALYSWDGSITNTFSDSGEITNVQFMDNKLYALVDEELCQYNNGTFQSLGLKIAGDYTVLSDGNRVIANVFDGEKSCLVLFTKNENGWNGGVQLTDGSNYIRNYQVVEDEDGSLTTAVCEVAVDLETEEIYGMADLYIDKLFAPTDIELLDTIYVDNPVAGETAVFNYELANKGEEAVSSYVVKVTDGNGTELASKEVATNLLGGTMEEGTIEVPMSETLTKQDYIITVSMADDSNADNNSATITVGESNVVVENPIVTEDGMLTGNISNVGYDDATEVKLNVYQDNMDSEPVYQFDYGTLAAGEEAEINIKLSGLKTRGVNEGLGSTWILDVETSGYEESYGDNTETVFNYRDLDISVDDNVTVGTGKTAQIHVTDTITGEDFTDKVLWKSENEEIVTVTKTGEIMGVSEGTANVYVWFKDMKYSCTVTVENSEESEEPIEPTPGTTETTEIPTPGTTETTEAPTPGTTEAPTTEKPTTEEDTEITEEPEAPGEDTKVRKITIFGMSKKIAAGKKIALLPRITPDNATNKNVTWSTSNKKYATVNSKGVVTTKKKGAGKKVTITATAKDGSRRKATFKISIMKHAVKSVKLSAKTKTVKAGKKLTIKPTIKTTGKKVNKTLKWTSSNTKYAMVNSKGVVTAKKAGKRKKVKITAMATDGTGKKATITIKIK